MNDVLSGKLWEEIGSLDELEVMHVLTSLFSIYERRLQNNPGDPESLRFFNNLGLAIAQVGECNLNRR